MNYCYTVHKIKDQIQGPRQKKKSSGRYLKNLNLARASSIIQYLLLQARAR